MLNRKFGVDEFQLLPLERKTALLACIAQRLLPEYASFVERTEFGSVAVYEHALTLIWEHVAGKRLSLRDIGELFQSLEDHLPDHDSFGGDFDGLYSGFALACALESCEWPPRNIDFLLRFSEDYVLDPNLIIQICESKKWDRRVVADFRSKCMACEPIVDWDRFCSDSG